MKIIFMDEDFEFFEIEMKKAGISMDRGMLFWEALRNGEKKIKESNIRLLEIQEKISVFNQSS